MGQTEPVVSSSSTTVVRHHFITFVKNSKGQLLELDGTKYGPRVILEKSDDLLKEVAKELI